MLEKSKSVLSFNSAVDKEEDMLAQTMEEKSEVEDSKSGWIEHTWSTFIRRVEEDSSEDEPKGKILLSSFQKEKFTHFFHHVLVPKNANYVSPDDFDSLNTRMRQYMHWSVHSPQYLSLYEVHNLFLQHFLTNAKQFDKKEEGFDFGFKLNGEDAGDSETKDKVTLDEWLDVWGEIVGEARTLQDLPMWLQCYPKTLFSTINRSGSGVITKTELALFFTAFLAGGKLGNQELAQITDKSYNAMTSYGDAELSYHIYKLSFLNFLLGKQPNGPGQFMFGIIEYQEMMQWLPVEYTQEQVVGGQEQTDNQGKEKATCQEIVKQYDEYFTGVDMKTKRRSVLV